MEKANSYYDWQMKFRKKSTRPELDNADQNQFGKYLYQLAHKHTIYKAATQKSDNYEIYKYDKINHIIRVIIYRKNKNPSFMQLNLSKNLITHNCREFNINKVKKRFCKHLVKLFLLLKESNKEYSLFLLKKICNNIDRFNFS